MPSQRWYDVVVLIEVVQRHTLHSLVPPVEHACKVYESSYASEIALVQRAKINFLTEFEKKLQGDAELKAKLVSEDWFLDAVLLSQDPPSQ